MCGISGIYRLTGLPVKQAELEAQISAMVHRGPNQGATFVAPGGQCGLGVRRLSIIDVAGGQQPIRNEDETIQLIYNGETYNHQLLRGQLEQLGHQPHSHSDAEVIVHGYEVWDAEGVLAKLQGMFAFALWDQQQQRLFLARDRFGIKPLYYAEHQGRLYFGSEIKTILADPGFPRRVNLAALQALLTVGFVPGPETMFQGIYKIPPAHWLIAQNGRFQLKRYWQLTYQEATPLSEQEAAEEFLVRLRECVQSHLMSEVPLGALLSGGLDSGMLVALIQAGLGHNHNGIPMGHPHKLQTVSIGFDQAAYDEAPLALSLAQTIGTEHHPITFTLADFNDYPQVMRHLEEPQAAATALPIYKLYQACRQAGLTVVLTGEGADELLGGYHWHRGDALVRPMLAWPAQLRQFLAALPVPMSPAARRVLTRGSHQVAWRYQTWLEIDTDGYQDQLLTGAVRAELSSNPAGTFLNYWTELIDGMQNEAPLHQTLWLEAQTRMVDFINFEVDKMSMASSIEARVPYLDHTLWEFCATLPAHYKLKGKVEKHLLRLAATSILPESTRTRRKKGLASPYARWLQAKRLPEWAEETLSARALRQVGLFEPATVQRLRQAHQSGQPNLGPLLMGVLSTQVWYQTFLSR
jgi:asparagine synthase (glutamine-hydrolysing)